MRGPEHAPKEPIAIIGLGCVLPDAPDAKTFWDNVLAGRSSIREVPRDRWDPALFYDTDKSAPDKTYTKIGGFVLNDAFSGLDYRMPPSTVAQIDPVQRWALSATRQAFKDAGYRTGLRGDEGKEFDRNRCAIILGNAMGGELQKQTSRRVYWPEAAAAIRGNPEFQSLPKEQQEAILGGAEAQFKQGLIPITEDTMPGSLSNVVAGRIANVFDLAGKNFTTDAACASSFAALDAAVHTLQDHESDLVLWGGSDRSMDVSSYIQFSKIGALSPDGSRPFDAAANGFVMGEGCAMFLLKRLADAERDGDKVYAVVRGIGASSDGKGKGITAPNPAGQVKAVVRAYQDAGVDPATVGLLEAHGTSTPVGDPVELQSVQEAFEQMGQSPIKPGSVAVGSVKGNIGHLKAAAGAAGVLKAALALKVGVLPPSINVRTLNPRIDWAKAPFKVQTQAQPWPRPAGHPRRAAVSSFGFGGTNFHIVLEEHVPGLLTSQREPASTTKPPIAPIAQTVRSSVESVQSVVSSVVASATIDLPAFQAAAKRLAPLEAEPVVIDAAAAPGLVPQMAGWKADFLQAGQGDRVREVLHPITAAGLEAQARVAFSVADLADVPRKLAQAQEAATNPAKARLAFQQGVYLNEGRPQGKVAFLFPGQGTQYVNMLRDLSRKYEVVRNTFEEADQVLLDELDGVRLTDILWPTPDTPEAQAASERKLQLTEFTQPAVLAADVAILRLLRQWGIQPDVVAGHSLGEYGALVAADVLTFADALHAVAARGREMAHVEVPDLGKMASVSADWHAVTEMVRSVTEYVIPANKNSPSQTVIAGSSKGIDQAIALLQQKGLQVQPLPVSAAFHSSIVAPASKPLRTVLARLGVKPPRVRVLSNVGAQPYEDDVEWILDNLATQVASPVEWIGIVERMYAEGVRTFVEVGPKLALTNFVRDILKEKGDAVAIGSNHPKKGGIAHANELFAFLGAWGFRPRLPALDDHSVYTREHRDPAAPFRRAAATNPLDPLDAPKPTGGSVGSVRSVDGQGRDTRLDALAKMADDLRRLVEQERRTAPTAAAAVDAQAIESEVLRRIEAFGFNLDDIGVSGISVGLPGTGKALFADDNWDRILAGQNLIDPLPAEERQKIVDKNIVRLSKGGDGSAQFQVVSDIAQVIQLAGRRGGFDIAQYGVGKELADSLDRTFQYAIAAGLEALRDAGIPLVRTYLQTSQGGHLPKEWKLPEPLRDETGIVFASAFPGYDNLLRDVSRYLADKYSGRTRDELNALYNELIGLVEDPAARDRLQTAFDVEFTRLGGQEAASSQARYEFNRKFLFNVLSMGHSQLAQLIGARGPNTQVNAACASTTQAVAIAEDWIRTGRCRRVLVVGADDVTSDAMFEWIGAGFLASGAATTQPDVTKAALPFDRRRHGMIVGMGAVGLVLEAVPEATRRGMRPIARLLASRVSNSAFHGSRLDVDHIAGEMKGLLASAGRRYGLTPEGIAAQTVFMSHETYTPARGGSASAEVHALRATFGPAANKVVVANTKGFTGHPQGAGVEDAIVLKCLQRGQLPPIANFREPDPELGDLNLSKGGRYDVRYALRLAAGFGSQVAMTLTELVAREAERVADPQRYQAWLSEVSGLPNAKVEVQNRTLRIVDQGPPSRVKQAPATAQIIAAPPAPREPPTPVAIEVPPEHRPAASAPKADVLPRLVDLVAQKTGYPKDLLDPDLDMEADLGIDTVKQAELFGAIRDAYGLPLEEGIQIKDYPTLRKVAGYVQTRLGGPSAPLAAPAQPPISPIPPIPSPSVKSVKSVAPLAPLEPSGDVLARLVDLVAQKTGYPKDLLDPNLDMEADLGIDTVKQAELFGAIRDAYGLPLEEGIQIKDYPTLAKVAGYVQARLGGAPTAAQPPMTAATSSVPSVKSVVPSAAASGGGVDEAAVLRKVIDLVAAKTGYPSDMLEPDLDMEADLGIDTVKQAELFGEVRAAYGIPMVEGLLIKDYPTLRKVAGFVLQHAASTPTTAQPQTTQNTQTAAASVSSVSSVDRPERSGIVRRVPTLRPQPMPEQPNPVPRGPVLVLGDADDAWMEALRSAGFEPSTSAQAPVGLVALALRPGASPLDRVGPVFDAAKAHRASLAAGFVLVVTRQDGAHGLKSVRDPTMAALAGLGKALKKEFPQATTKVVDLHTETPHATETAVRELLFGGPRTEVCFGHDGTRHVVEVSPQDLPDGVAEVAGKGLVVSGGAQGITVELLAALAPQKPKVLLLGRTEVPAEAAEWAALDAAGWKAKEAGLVEAMKARGERVTPVAIQKALAPLQKAAEVHRNLHRLTDLGAEVLYAPVDVTNASAVNDAVAWARDQWGRIDGVLHAAGVEVSKDLSSKDRAQFDTVFGIKADGWRALMEATSPDRLEFVAAFGSVAGRFGNVGQTDYSAANEYLCKAVKHEAARRKCSGFTISWGPWGEVGMATKGSILQIMHASGVTPIPTAEGVRHFLAELAVPGIRESVVAGDLGAIDADRQVVSQGWDVAVAVANELLGKHPERFRLLESVEACTPERSLQATLVLDQARDPGIADHRVDGVPYLPGVFGLEAFAEAASLLVPEGTRYLGAEDVQFALPLKQLKTQPVTARIHCEVAPGDGKETRVACRLTTQFVGPDGKPHGEPRLHFQATVRFGAGRTAPHATAPVPTADLPRARIYPPFFHGPGFQVLASAGPLEKDSAVAAYREPTEAHFAAGPARFTSNPMLVEALFQVCGLGAMASARVMALPAGIERVDLYHAGPAAQEVRLVGHFMGRTPEGLRKFDAQAVAKDGTVLLRLQGYTMVETGPAPPLPTASAVSAPVIPGADVPLPALDDVHFAAVPVTPGAPADAAWFTPAERAQHAAFKAPKRADEWRAGRLAAKKAAMDTHPGIGPLDVEVVAESDSGRPRLRLKGQESALWLSISHRAGLAMAALSPGPVGLDLETVEDRERSFLEEAFSVGELKSMLDATDAGADPRVFAACMWSAKEAALKRAGVGLKADLRAHHVVPDGQGGATVSGPTGTVGVRFFDAGGLVLAVTAPQLDPMRVGARP